MNTEPPIYGDRNYRLPHYMGEVVKIDGICYKFLGFDSSSAADDVDLGEVSTYETCEDCSAIPSSSSSEESPQPSSSSSQVVSSSSSEPSYSSTSSKSSIGLESSSSSSDISSIS